MMHLDRKVFFFFSFPVLLVVPTQRLCRTSLDKAVRDKFSLHGCCCTTTALCSPTLPLLTRPGSDGDDTSLPHATHPSSMTSIAGYTTGRTESAARRPRTDPPTGAAHSAAASLHTHYSQGSCCLLKTERRERGAGRSPVTGEEASNVWK